MYETLRMYPPAVLTSRISLVATKARLHPFLMARIHVKWVIRRICRAPWVIDPLETDVETSRIIKIPVLC